MEVKSEKTLSSLLWGLAKNIVEKVRDALAKGELIKTKAVYMKPKIEKFEYKEGSANYQTSFNYLEREEWHWRDQHDFTQKIVKQFPEYSDSVKEITKKYKVSEGQSEFWLSRFVQILTRKAIEPLSDEFLVDQVTTFVTL